METILDLQNGSGNRSGYSFQTFTDMKALQAHFLGTYWNRVCEIVSDCDNSSEGQTAEIPQIMDSLEDFFQVLPSDDASQALIIRRKADFIEALSFVLKAKAENYFPQTEFEKFLRNVCFIGIKASTTSVRGNYDFMKYAFELCSNDEFRMSLEGYLIGQYAKQDVAVPDNHTIGALFEGLQTPPSFLWTIVLISQIRYFGDTRKDEIEAKMRPIIEFLDEHASLLQNSKLIELSLRLGIETPFFVMRDNELVLSFNRFKGNTISAYTRIFDFNLNSLEDDDPFKPFYRKLISLVKTTQQNTDEALVRYKLIYELLDVVPVEERLRKSEDLLKQPLFISLFKNTQVSKTEVTQIKSDLLRFKGHAKALSIRVGVGASADSGIGLNAGVQPSGNIPQTQSAMSLTSTVEKPAHRSRMSNILRGGVLALAAVMSFGLLGVGVGIILRPGLLAFVGISPVTTLAAIGMPWLGMSLVLGIVVMTLALLPILIAGYFMSDNTVLSANTSQSEATLSPASGQPSGTHAGLLNRLENTAGAAAQANPEALTGASLAAGKPSVDPTERIAAAELGPDPSASDDEAYQHGGTGRRPY